MLLTRFLVFPALISNQYKGSMSHGSFNPYARPHNTNNSGSSWNYLCPDVNPELNKADKVIVTMMEDISRILFICYNNMV